MHLARKKQFSTEGTEIIRLNLGHKKNNWLSKPERAESHQEKRGQ